MNVIIDTKEQAPWRFSNTVTCYRRAIPTGDYSIESYEQSICVERKSLNDLVKTVIHDWLRFSRQLRRMAAMDYACIIVEAPLTAVKEKKYEGDTAPNSVQGKLNSIYLEFGVPTLFLDNRTYAAEWVENMFRLYLEKRGR